MTKNQLADIYIHWVNDFLTIGGFADHYGLDDDQADILLNLARHCYYQLLNAGIDESSNIKWPIPLELSFLSDKCPGRDYD